MYHTLYLYGSAFFFLAQEVEVVSWSHTGLRLPVWLCVHEHSLPVWLACTGTILSLDSLLSFGIIGMYHHFHT